MDTKSENEFWKSLFEVDSTLSCRLFSTTGQSDSIAIPLPKSEELFHVTIRSATSISETFLSDTFYLVASSGDGSDHHRAFCKVLPSDHTLRENALEVGVFRKEIAVYTILFPELFLNGPLRVPILHHFDREDRSYLILEDLKSQGFSLARRTDTDGCDIHHLQLALTALAEYHAASIGYLHRIKKADGSFDLQEELHFMTERQSKVEANLFKTIIQHTLPLYIDYFKRDGHAEVAQWLEKMKEDKFEEMYHHDDIIQPDSLLCILHGDFWIDNVMFRYANELHDDRPLDIKIIDWQLVKLGHPGRDIAYFIYNCSSGITRRKHLKPLLEEYFNNLTASLPSRSLLKCTLDRFMNDMKEKFVWAMFMAFMSLPGSMDLNFATRFNDWKDYETKDESSKQDLVRLAEKMVLENLPLRQRILDIVYEVKEMAEGDL